MSAHLKLGEADFKEKYLRVETQDEDFSWFELKEVPTPPEEERDGVVMQAGLDCVFLDRDTIKGKAICSMYDVRPLQCRTWPFCEELVDEDEVVELADRIGPHVGDLEERVQVELERHRALPAELELVTYPGVRCRVP